MNADNLSSRVRDFERKQVFISIISLFVISLLAVIFNNLHMHSLASENTKYLTRYISVGDRREVTLVLNQAHLSNFTTIRYQSKVSDQSFSIPASSEYESRVGFFDDLLRDQVVTEVVSDVSSNGGDKIIYEFLRFRLVPYAFLIWVGLILMSVPQIVILKRRLVRQYEKDLEIEKKVAKAEIAREVRHNLRMT